MAVNKEIERKFLVNGAYRSCVIGSHRIAQGYLSTNLEHTVRVRLKDKKGYLTIKGRSNRSGLSRLEWEIEIPFALAERFFNICDSTKVLDKTRYIVPAGKHYFEVDEFHGANAGLTVAEVELSDEAESFVRPDWLGEEVTGDERYYNSQLTVRPFCDWEGSIKG